MSEKQVKDFFTVQLGCSIAEKLNRFARADAKQRLRHVSAVLKRAGFKPLELLLYLGLHLISFGRPVRIGTLNAKGRISIMISYIEPYVRSLQLEGIRKALLIVINPGRCPNEQLTKMYGRAVWLLDDRHPKLRTIFAVAYRVLVEAGSSMDAHLKTGQGLRFQRAWQEGKPVLRFTREEHEKGRRLLGGMGISKEASYICFGLRDAAYYQQFLTSEAHAHARHLNTEAGEDTYVRNPPLVNYLPMANDCANRGLYVLRMGQVVSGPLPPGLHPNIIDYARKYRTPFGDIYLLATCKFVVAGGVGLWWISTAFHRPAVVTDSYALWGGWLREGDLFIPNKLWLVSEKRFLTFREMLMAGRRYSYESNCRKDGVELVHNSPEEIAAVVFEMDQRLDGVYQSCGEDEDLQKRFKVLYSHDHPGYASLGRIGAEFLRQNSHLL